MSKRAWRSTLALMLVLTVCSAPDFAETIQFVNSELPPADYWQLANECTVLIGTVSEVTDHVTIKVEKVLKGEGIPETVSFPTPPIPPDNATKIICGGPRIWKFQPAERWILFLASPIPPFYPFCDGFISARMPRVEQSVNEFLAFTALPDDRSKCAFLVQLIVAGSPSAWPAIQLLPQYNTAEFLPLLSSLATNEFGKRTYWRFLTKNPSPEATVILRRMTQSEQPPLLAEVLDALGRREKENEELSKELMLYLTHADPVIRRSTVFILNYRDYRPAFPDIVLRLKDVDHSVRASALAWPWYSYVKDHPEVLKQIKKMRSDPDARVRSAAKLALASTSAWYRFWY